MRLCIDGGELCLVYVDKPDYREWLYFRIGKPMSFGFARCIRYDGLCKGYLWLWWIGIWWGVDYEHIGDD